MPEREPPKLGRPAEPLLDGPDLDRFTVPLREGPELGRPTEPVLAELGLDRLTVPLREGPELVRQVPLVRGGAWRVTVPVGVDRVIPVRVTDDGRAVRGGVRTTDPVRTVPGTVLVTVGPLVVLGRVRSTVPVRLGVVRATVPVRAGRVGARWTVGVLPWARVRLGCEEPRCPVSRAVVRRAG